MTIFGNSATWLDQTKAAGALGALVAKPDEMLFKFLAYFPAVGVSSTLAIAIIFIFFVTSADSGIFVMNSIASNNAEKSPKWQLTFWGALLALVALVLLNAGGLQSLQTMTLITALPFSIIMLLFCYSLVRGLIVDNNYYTKGFSVAASNWSGELWKERLQRILSSKSKESVNDFMQQTVQPALQELAAAFASKGTAATVQHTDNPMDIALTIKHELIEDFVYGVQTQSKTISNFLVKEDNVPDVTGTKQYIPRTYFGDNRPGYSIEYFTQNEIIADVLKQYERFLELSSEVKNEIFTDITLKRRE
jgi:choline/glycine/proline betaine transport protein